jgi:alpha-tubulin suppressor-like RCC1 family protein
VKRRPTRRAFLIGSLMTAPAAFADATGRDLASYYERHMALIDGVAHGWIARAAPRALLPDVRQVGVGKDAWFALRNDGALLRWTDAPADAVTLMRGVAYFAAGDSGWFAIDRDGVLWRGGSGAPARIADEVIDACIGDSADYCVRRDGTLFVKGLAHRGQYGDGLLTATTGFVATARDALAVRAHTGHALHLRRDGVVMGTGGNRFGPLSSHGLGDKADRWGAIFDAAIAIATGSRHSLAIRRDGSLWAWGAGFAIEPRRLMDRVSAAAAGDTATLARDRDGALWQWDDGVGPRRLEPDRR